MIVSETRPLSSLHVFCTAWPLEVQFGSKMGSMRTERSICAPPRLSSAPQRCLWNGSNVRLTDDGPLSSFQGWSSSASSFHTSLLQAIDGVMSLDLCPQVVTQAPQHFRSSEKQVTCEGCFARKSICSVVSLHSGMSRAVQPTGAFGGGSRPSTHSSLGFPFHFSLFIASSLNLWWWWHVWSDYHLFPPPLSSWRLRSYKLHCLHG